EAMEYRLAIEADARDILLQRLEGFVDNHTSTGVHIGQVKRSPGSSNDTTLFEADADGRSLLHIWLQKKNLANIARVWVRGVNIDWMCLYTEGAEQVQADRHKALAPVLPHRISLPIYPFARERYWVSGGAGVGSTQGPLPTSAGTGSTRG